MKIFQIRKIYKICVVAIVVLAGCAPEVTNWTPAESPKENKVDRSVFTHTIHYPAHAEVLGNLEKKRFHQFLQTIIPNPFAVKVTIVEYGGYSEKRVGDIKRAIIKYGVPPNLITVDYDQVEEHGQVSPKSHKKGSHSGVEVIVERFVVIPPSCANFSQQIGDAQQAYTGSNFGCATANNFGMMIANPRDLLRGRTMDPYDGTVMASGVHRYLTDKIKPIAEISTTASTQTPQTGAATTPTAAPAAGGGY